MEEVDGSNPSRSTKPTNKRRLYRAGGRASTLRGHRSPEGERQLGGQTTPFARLARAPQPHGERSDRGHAQRKRLRWSGVTIFNPWDAAYAPFRTPATIAGGLPALIAGARDQIAHTSPSISATAIRGQPMRGQQLRWCAGQG